MPPVYHQIPFYPNSPCYFNNLTAGVVLTDSYDCAPGFMCPNLIPFNSTTRQVICPASSGCQFARLSGLQCSPQGNFEPWLCEPGHYCDGKVQLVCPKGHWCPSGTVEPRPCSMFSSCPSGSIMQTDATGLVIVGIIDILLIMLYFGAKARDLLVKGQPLSNLLPVLIRPLCYRLFGRPESVDQTETIETGEKVNNQEWIVEEPVNLIDSLVGAWKTGLGGSTIGVDFRFENMGFALPDGKTILQGVSGQIRSSRMTAIMGPSGAGKTTFMNVLMGKIKRTKGILYVNDVETEMYQYRKVIGYVPQEDIMIRELSVREIVRHSALTRLPRSWTAQQVDTFVDDLLKALKLTCVADTEIGDEIRRGISGGQRKRVNIAIEMAAVPVCLFLDEPTSGLDSTAALDVAELLQQVTKLGLTIVSVIHQPRIEIFRKFDDVLMIAPGGRTAYLGPTEAARPYFESLGYVFDPSANEADVLMDILSGHGVNLDHQYTPNDLVHFWTKHASISVENSAETLQPVENRVDSFDKQMKQIVHQRGASIFKQIILVHNRSVVQQIRTASTLALEMFVGLFAGFLIGIGVSQPEVFWSVFVHPYEPLSTSPLTMYVPLSGLLIGCSIALASGPAGVNVFSSEKPVYWREAACGHSPLAYYIGKTVATIYRSMLSSLHFTALYVVMSHPVISFGQQYIVILGFFFGVYGASAVVSMIVRRENASLLSAVINLFASVFCGFGPSIVDAKDWGLYFIWTLSHNYWGSEAMYSENISVYRNVYQIQAAADDFGYVLNRFWTDVGFMFLLGIVWRIVAFFLMILMNRDKQR